MGSGKRGRRSSSEPKSLSPASIYLAAAGVGTIRIVDFDKVELSNLNRQVLHCNENIGSKKIDSAVAKLKK
jgi:adenylyltransferase/sulfurtransferase